MQHVAQEHAEKQSLPYFKVCRRSQNNCLSPGEEEEMRGELIVERPVQSRVGGRGRGRGEGLEVAKRIEEVEEGAPKGSKRLGVGGRRAVDQGNLLVRYHGLMPAFAQKHRRWMREEGMYVGMYIRVALELDHAGDPGSAGAV